MTINIWSIDILLLHTFYLLQMWNNLKDSFNFTVLVTIIFNFQRPRILLHTSAGQEETSSFKGQSRYYPFGQYSGPFQTFTAFALNKYSSIFWKTLEAFFSHSYSNIQLKNRFAEIKYEILIKRQNNKNRNQLLRYMLQLKS